MAKETSESLMERKLDVMIALLARSLYGGQKIADIAPQLARIGLTVDQIAAALDTSPKNVRNRLGEAKRSALPQDAE